MPKKMTCVVRGCRNKVDRYGCLCLGCLRFLTLADSETGTDSLARGSAAYDKAMRLACDKITSRVATILYDD